MIANIRNALVYENAPCAGAFDRQQAAPRTNAAAHELRLYWMQDDSSSPGTEDQEACL